MIQQMFYAHCDTPGCECEWGPYPARGRERSDIRLQLKSEGWKLRGAEVFCPSCVFAEAEQVKASAA